MTGISGVLLKSGPDTAYAHLQQKHRNRSTGEFSKEPTCEHVPRFFNSTRFRSDYTSRITPRKPASGTGQRPLGYDRRPGFRSGCAFHGSSGQACFG